MFAVSLISPLPLVWFSAEGQGGGGAWRLTLLQQLGLSPSCYTSSPLAALGPLLLVVVLFTGPLLEVVARGALVGPSHWEFEEDPLLAVRAYIVAPLTEEWVFRACSVPLLALSGYSHSTTVALSCALFGLVHAHHVWWHAGAPWQERVSRVCLQCAYTSLFGGIMAHAYLKSGSFLGVVAAHTFANFMGLPSLHFALNPKAVCYSLRRGVLAGYALGIAAFLWLLVGDTGIWRGAACATVLQ